MRKAAVLARLNRHLLEEYSRRTSSALRARLPLPLALSWLDRLLAANVAKEVRKDARVIECAVQAHAQGQLPGETEVNALLGEMAKIDRDFLQQLGGMPLAIVIRYEAVTPLRRRRVSRLLTAAQHLCEAWEACRGLKAALAADVAGGELERLIRDLLLLYAEETRILGESVRMPVLLSPLKNKVLASLFQTMEGVALKLASEAGKAVALASVAKPARH